MEKKKRKEIKILVDALFLCRCFKCLKVGASSFGANFQKENFSTTLVGLQCALPRIYLQVIVEPSTPISCVLLAYPICPLRFTISREHSGIIQDNPEDVDVREKSDFSSPSMKCPKPANVFVCSQPTSVSITQ